MEKGREAPATFIDKLKGEQVKRGETVHVGYEPGRIKVIRKTGAYFTVVSSNDRKILADDEVKFTVAELHYPLTFTEVVRKGSSIGRVHGLLRG